MLERVRKPSRAAALIVGVVVARQLGQVGERHLLFTRTYHGAAAYDLAEPFLQEAPDPVLGIAVR